MDEPSDDETFADVEQLKKLADIANDQTLPREWRDAAVTDAQAIAKKHGK